MPMQRKLTAVMFTDIVGYSALVHADERGARTLLQMHRTLLRHQFARYGGRQIDTTGDGTLAIFDSALAAAECAVAIQAALAQRNAAGPPAQPLRLRIGLHQGDVERTRRGVYGDGVNVCARLEPLSPPGGICASSLVVAQIHGPLRQHFHSAGAQQLKNIAEPVEVFKLAEADVITAAAALPAPQLKARTAWRWWLATGALALLATLIGSGLWWWSARTTPAPAEASIAVLPLENLATESGSAEFVAGLHDSLITEIARAPQLKVISRSSVMRYAQQRASIAEVAALLKVANVLEGSVQRSGARVRVNVQLIRAATDEHLWAEVYDRNIEDLFDLQTEIAREIARKIHGNLALPAMPATERPTASAAAYELYLRAISREENDPRLGYTPPDEPLQLLEKAVAIDPKFALAHAARARYAAWGAHWARYADPARIEGYVARAMNGAQTAMALNPELPESLLGMGLAVYWKERDPKAAERYFVQALERRPGYPAALYMLSGVYDALGDAERSIANVSALLDIDPANDKAAEQLTLLLTRLRRYEDADRAYARWLQMTESRGYVEYLRAQLHFYRSGDLKPWKRIAEQPQAADPSLPDLRGERWTVAMYEGRLDDAAALAAPLAQEFLEKRSGDYTWAYYAGSALALSGEKKRAQPYLDAVAAVFIQTLKTSPDDTTLLDSLGQVQALKGERDAALNTFQRLLALKQPPAGRQPSSDDYDTLAHYAQACAQLGLREEALKQLERLLREPSGQHAHAVQRDPTWGSLLQDADFQALVRRHLPQR